MPATAALAMKAAEENLAKNKQPKALPKGDRMPPEERRHQPIPQALDDKAKDNARERDP
jgi:hypothetical protein